MAAIVALRWICGLYRGAISGFERLVWLSGFNCLIATVRFVLVIPFFIFVSVRPTAYFGFQLAVALLEIAVLVVQTYRWLPPAANGGKIAWQWQPLRAVLKFSLSIAFGSSVWVLVTQTDKLVLSKLLPLTEYGYFSLAVLAASGVLMVSGPVSMALQPRLNKLSAEGDDNALIHLYRNATQLVGVLAIPAALMLAFFAEQVLWAWTGNADIAHKAAPILALYALGNGVLALGAFPYYLQLAKGDLKLHLIGSALFVLLLIPALIIAAWHFGAVGAGYAWLAANLVFFLFWVPRVHDRFVKGLHAQWLLHDVGKTVMLTMPAALLAQWLVRWPQQRAPVALEIAGLSIALLLLGAASSPWVRNAVGTRLRMPTNG